MTNLDTIRALSPPARFLYFIAERELTRLHKELIGGPPPHSDDPIIAVNHFCNINREDDAVTRWIKTHVRDKDYDANDMVVQVLASRIWNHPPVLERLLPIRSPAKALKVLRAIRAGGEKTLRGAYMMPVHGEGGKGRSVDEYHITNVIKPSRRVHWEDLRTLQEVAERLLKLAGVGEFIANQICADLRYTRHWGTASDWRTFILCGPGTRRGLDRYINHGPKLGADRQATYIERLLAIREELRDKTTYSDLFSDPNNLANCFCEWDKYERVLHGESARLRKYP